MSDADGVDHLPATAIMQEFHGRLPVGDDVKPQVAAADAHAGPVGAQGGTHRQALDGDV